MEDKDWHTKMKQDAYEDYCAGVIGLDEFNRRMSMIDTV